MLLITEELGELAKPLEPFTDHRLYGAAVWRIAAVLQSDGHKAAQDVANELAEHFEDVALSNYLEGAHL